MTEKLFADGKNKIIFIIKKKKEHIVSRKSLRIWNERMKNIARTPNVRRNGNVIIGDNISEEISFAGVLHYFYTVSGDVRKIKLSHNFSTIACGKKKTKNRRGTRRRFDTIARGFSPVRNERPGVGNFERSRKSE